MNEQKPNRRVANLARIIGLAVALQGSQSLSAGEADVIEAAAQPMSDGSYVVIATITHADESFAHFANNFEVLTPDGTVIATRPLNHPHVDEQPFTRALPRVKVPKGIKTVIVRANDKQHGSGGKEITVTLPDR